MSTVKIEGLAELQRKLQELPGRIGTNVARRAVYAAAAIIRDDAIQRAPYWHGPVSEGHPPPGTLKKAIYVKYIREQSNANQVVYFVGVRHGKSQQHVGKNDVSYDAYYWRWVEFQQGHSPNSVAYMRPAFDAKQNAAVQVMKDTLASGISDEVAKL